MEHGDPAAEPIRAARAAATERRAHVGVAATAAMHGRPHRLERGDRSDRAAAAPTPGSEDERAHGGACKKLDAAILRAQARDALVGLGWKSAVAHTAVAEAAAAGTELTLERLIFEALRRCPAPRL